MISNTNNKLIVILMLLAKLSTCFHNPGIIIQIPTNYSLPVINPQVPQPIPSIVLQNFELSNIELRQVIYSWKYQGDRFVILLERTLISFDWKYGRNGGIGTFVEQYSDLVVQVAFDVDKDFRFKIDVEGAKITNEDKRHSIKINLGGNVPQTIVIQVTNLILNHAKVAFRAAIKSAIVKVVQVFTQPLRKDFKVICKNSSATQNKQQCIYINTTLVGKPLIYQSTQIIQVNGAPYKQGHPSGYLDPSDAMFKVKSSQINVQIHQSFFNTIIKLYNDIQPIRKTINSTEISSVVDIDSQTLSVVFPKMRDFDPRPVLLNIDIKQANILLNQPPFLTFQANGTVRVDTQRVNEFQPYINKIGGSFIVKIQPIIGVSEAGLRVHKVVVKDIDVSDQDIRAGLIRPDQVMKHIQTLMQWAQGGTNGQLNTKKFNLQFATLKIHPNLSILTRSINIQIKFISSTLEMQQI